MKRRVQIEGYIWMDKDFSAVNLFFTPKSTWAERFLGGFSTSICGKKGVCHEGFILYRAFNQNKKKFRIPVMVTFEGEGRGMK